MHHLWAAGDIHHVEGGVNVQTGGLLRFLGKRVDGRQDRRVALTGRVARDTTLLFGRHRGVLGII